MRGNKVDDALVKQPQSYFHLMRMEAVNAALAAAAFDALTPLRLGRMNVTWSGFEAAISASCDD